MFWPTVQASHLFKPTEGCVPVKNQEVKRRSTRRAALKPDYTGDTSNFAEAQFFVNPNSNTEQLVTLEPLRLDPCSPTADVSVDFLTRALPSSCNAAACRALGKAQDRIGLRTSATE